MKICYKPLYIKYYRSKLCQANLFLKCKIFIKLQFYKRTLIYVGFFQNFCIRQTIMMMVGEGRAKEKEEEEGGKAEEEWGEWGQQQLWKILIKFSVTLMQQFYLFFYDVLVLNRTQYPITEDTYCPFQETSTKIKHMLVHKERKK